MYVPHCSVYLVRQPVAPSTSYCGPCFSMWYTLKNYLKSENKHETVTLFGMALTTLCASQSCMSCKLASGTGELFWILSFREEWPQQNDFTAENKHEAMTSNDLAWYDLDNLYASLSCTCMSCRLPTVPSSGYSGSYLST